MPLVPERFAMKLGAQASCLLLPSHERWQTRCLRWLGAQASCLLLRGHERWQTRCLRSRLVLSFASVLLLLLFHANTMSQNLNPSVPAEWLTHAEKTDF